MKIANILIDSLEKKEKLKAVENSFLDYALYLTKRGENVLSIFRADSEIKTASQKVSTSIYELSANFFLKKLSLLKLWIKLVNFEPDVAICHSKKALFLTRISRFFCIIKFPIISLCNDDTPKNFRKSDYVIVRSSTLVKEFISLGILRNRIFVINKSIEVANNFQILAKPKFGDIIKIGSIGSITEGKNFDKIIQAMLILKEKNINCEFFILGEGDFQDSLTLLAQELGLSDHLKIIDFKNNIKNFFENIDIAVMPLESSACDDFILDPMLYSTPIIASYSKHYEEIIENNINGLKIKLNPAKEIPNLIANAVEIYAKDEIEAKQMAKRAYEKIIDHHASEVIANKIHFICVNSKDFYLN
ncbi:MAG: glycosyltransferase family 4 protein [Alphaproteobacteria bacterium]